jgi:hypothetical protein
MSKIVQEKFQEEFPVKPDDGSNFWASDKSARVKKGMPGSEYSKASSAGVMYNSLPPGMDIDDQEVADIRHEPSVETGVSDVSYDCLRPGVAKRGFIRKKMSPTDDLYTNEHVDMFYGEITVEVEDGEKETGFLERGNMLDRL